MPWALPLLTQPIGDKWVRFAREFHKVCFSTAAWGKGAALGPGLLAISREFGKSVDLATDRGGEEIGGHGPIAGGGAMAMRPHRSSQEASQGSMRLISQ